MIRWMRSFSEAGGRNKTEFAKRFQGGRESPATGVVGDPKHGQRRTTTSLVPFVLFVAIIRCSRGSPQKAQKAQNEIVPFVLFCGYVSRVPGDGHKRHKRHKLQNQFTDFQLGGTKVDQQGLAFSLKCGGSPAPEPRVRSRVALQAFSSMIKPDSTNRSAK